MLTITDALWDQLVAINAEVNRYKYKTDQQLYGTAEFWTIIDSSGGDCEDYALAKRAKLIELGWPLDSLSIATCYVETGEYHAVLLVDSDRGTIVLDNRHSKPMAWTDLRYRWDKRQRGKQWVAIAA